MKKTLLLTTAMLGAFSFALTGCGGPSGDADAAAAGPSETSLEKTELSVGALPIPDYAAVYWADDKGYFEKEGLDVELVPVQGGPIGIQQVVAGQLDFTFTNTISAPITVAGGAPISMVALTSSLGDDSQVLFVKKDSAIKGLEDLDGKTIGVNTTNNMGDVLLNNLIKDQSLAVQPSYVEVPFNEMLAGVQSGSIDAGYFAEPFASAARESGLREAVDLTSGANEGIAAATFVGSNSFIEKNPNTTEAFARALHNANADIASNEGEFRTWFAGIGKLPEDVAKTMVLPTFETELDVAKIQKVADILADQAVVAKIDAGTYTYVAGE